MTQKEAHAEDIVLYQQPDYTQCITVNANTTYPLTSLNFYSAISSGKITKIKHKDFCGAQSNNSHFLIYDENENLIYTSPTRTNADWRCLDLPVGCEITDGINLIAGKNYKITSYTIIGNGNSNSWQASNNIFALTIYGEKINNISFNFPENATTTPDFESWHLNFGVAAEPPVAGTVRVNYGQDPNNYWNEYHDEVNFIAYDNEIAEVAIMKGNLLSAGSWFANGELIIGTSTVKTTVPDIAFSVLGGGGNLENFYYGAPTSTWATSTLPIQITCDPEDNFFQYSLCKLAVWLFVPDSGSLNKFSTLTDGIKNKPPIGYFYAVKSALEGLQSTSTKAFELNATSTGALANPVFNPLKTGIGFTLWLTFGFWLFNRIRHFEL